MHELDASYKLNFTDFSRIDAFHNAVVLTMGSSYVVQSVAIPLVPSLSRTVRHKHYSDVSPAYLTSQEPYLVHIYLAVAYVLKHDMALSNKTELDPEDRTALAYHLFHGTALHSQKVAMIARFDKLSNDELNAVWLSASILCTAYYGYLESHDPHHVWPLRAGPMGTEQDCVRINLAKQGLWDVVKPLREGSPYQALGTDPATISLPPQGSPITKAVLPSSFLALFELDEKSPCETCPYYDVVCELSHLIPQVCDSFTFMRFLFFWHQMPKTFTKLLETKDPRALLIQAYFYAKVSVYHGTWISRRAIVVGRSISIYLRTFCGDNKAIQELVTFPIAVLETLETSIAAAAERSTYILEETREPSSSITSCLRSDTLVRA